MIYYHILHLPLVHLTGLLLLSVLLGGAIGWERESHERPAGLRTHILVCLASTLITIVSNSSGSVGGRIAAQIVTGVGFLGAGTIMRDNSGGPVRGLTTAATLWTVAGLGIAIGYGGLYAEIATVTTVIALYTLTFLNKIENKLVRRRRGQNLRFFMEAASDPLQTVAELLKNFRKHGIKTRDLGFEEIPTGMSIEVSLNLPRSLTREDVEKIMHDAVKIIHYEWND